MRCVNKLMSIVVVLGLSGSGLVACGKKDPRAPLPGSPVPKQVTGLHDSLPEKLASVIKTNQAAKGLEECEKPHLKGAKELVDAIDGKSEELATFLKENGPKSTERAVGELKLSTVEAEKGETGWKEKTISWKDAIEAYAKLKDDAKISADWVALRDQVRQLVEADRRRLVQLQNVGLDKDSLATLEKVQELAHTCSLDARCERPQLDAESERFLLGNPVYAALVNGLDASCTLNGKRAYVNHLDRRVTYDRDLIFAFRLSSGAKRTSEKELTLTLDPGNAPEAIKEVLEEGWKSDALSLKVVLEKGAQSNSKDAKLYKLEVGDGATVADEAKHVLRIGTGSDVRRIAHEVGHILGFRDRRYTVWVASSCSYLVQSRAEDLMSSPASGSALAEDFATLKEQYKLDQAK